MEPSGRTLHLRGGTVKESGEKQALRLRVNRVEIKLVQRKGRRKRGNALTSTCSTAKLLRGRIIFPAVGTGKILSILFSVS